MTRLEVVVSQSCWGCEEAYALGTEVRHQLPWLEVDIIELDGTRPAPPAVFATPTYLLDGAIIALGNPSLAHLIEAIEQRAERTERSTSRRPAESNKRDPGGDKR